MATRIIKASDFKARCLRLMNVVNENGEEIIITRNGKPVSKLVPYHRRPKSLFGLHRGKIISHDDPVEPVDVHWDACDDST